MSHKKTAADYTAVFVHVSDLILWNLQQIVSANPLDAE